MVEESNESNKPSIIAVIAAVYHSTFDMRHTYLKELSNLGARNNVIKVNRHNDAIIII